VKTIILFTLLLTATACQQTAPVHAPTASPSDKDLYRGEHKGHNYDQRLDK